MWQCGQVVMAAPTDAAQPHNTYVWPGFLLFHLCHFVSSELSLYACFCVCFWDKGGKIQKILSVLNCIRVTFLIPMLLTHTYSNVLYSEFLDILFLFQTTYLGGIKSSKLIIPLTCSESSIWGRYSPFYDLWRNTKPNLVDYHIPNWMCLDCDCLLFATILIKIMECCSSFHQCMHMNFHESWMKLHLVWWNSFLFSYQSIW